MMLKSVSFSPLVPGKFYNAIQKCNNLSQRNGGQLKVFSTSLTCPQHLPSFYLLAAKSNHSGLRGCGVLPSLLEQGWGNSTALKPSKQLVAALFTHGNVNNVDGIATKSSQAVWRRSSDSIKSNSRITVKAIHGNPYSYARLQEGSSSSSSSSSPASGSAQKQLQAFRPWLLFGLCLCASAAAAAGSFAPRVLIGSPPAAAEALARRTTHPAASSSSRSESEASHGKKVYFDYHVTGVPGDGRCLFRAVAHGACLRSGRPPDESTQRQMADDLRTKALDELVRRRESSEWYILEQFAANK